MSVVEHHHFIKVECMSLQTLDLVSVITVKNLNGFKAECFAACFVCLDDVYQFMAELYNPGRFCFLVQILYCTTLRVIPAFDPDSRTQCITISL